MAQHDGDKATAAGSELEAVSPRTVSTGTAVATTGGAFENPGMPPHSPRATDLDPRKDKTAERRVGLLFLFSIVGSVFAIVAYIIFPIVPGDLSSVRVNNMLLGVGISVALLAIGLGAIYWAKNLMKDGEWEEHRHPTRGSEDTRAAAVEVFTLGNEESGFGRRSLIRNSLIGALVVSPLPAVVMFRDLAPAADPVALLKETLWEKDVRLMRDPANTPVKASEVTLGSVFQIIPENLAGREDFLEQKAKAAVLLMRLKPEDLHVSPERADWNYQGIVAYSKICTHVGCPVALAEQHTHHLLCPCHQSQFDISHEAKVIFGPAKRPLPQLPITVDAQGYLVARSGFHEPVGPSFWERS
ncbi:ubiquinol-cytochrome c reductase iron-sulfur subunit [Cryobacterium mesophilum]|uniref:Cytochrome bc1 complex Rieske iron-sulfur subunit n=1 Tax=Terrimesophilobacter mesophilus TaxID=433647 RepID=A0A4R8VA08_9MICO|nr:Rieske 2Fe-2S domain-containing protein [Terrimesophilobacter mesophilus]MBB5632022.1 ubiquinol-cytochrome c reductase iron-sulfur subunit [Terrimesophilobacter mesophilus]TFB78910.1 ubiquinol-cytochrome C reductase [Terrimesophilobacter mesophilus]